ncbi:hypothetical protein BBW65_05120 [Helicobacter enhydrae]|uniref:Uncharacterized protein n=1 Tax=Helicobacter enhydrae TaxID=222136 RepID=A0A1B1U640_9HELI|nr:hypothetical protein [Helicobacter enhydrae]ANV98218.1 hypothetical protein BBW65_05120 [Helicobacter enhydrae]
MKNHYSFIAPQKKAIFSPLSKTWFLYIFLMLLVIACIWLILNIQTMRIGSQTEMIEAKIVKQRERNQTLVSYDQILRTRIQELKTLQSNNAKLVTAIHNIFGLIPEQITINSISLTSKNLVIKGITPSKELYLFLLETPLSAIFSESRVDFYVLPSGWYNFVSVSKVVTGNN